MNYTETLRNYLLDNKGTIFDVNYEHEKKFGMIDKRTMIRILMRLDKDEHIITWIDKGVYFVNDGTECDENKIINWYTKDRSGCLIGGFLLKKLGIVDEYDGPIEVLTRRTVANKTIGNIKIVRTKMLSIGSSKKELITILEIVEKAKLTNCNLLKMTEEISKRLYAYDDLTFELIVCDEKYKASTIVRLESLLKEKGKENRCMEIFMKNYKE